MSVITHCGCPIRIWVEVGFAYALLIDLDASTVLDELIIDSSLVIAASFG